MTWAAAASSAGLLLVLGPVALYLLYTATLIRRPSWAAAIERPLRRRRPVLLAGGAAAAAGAVFAPTTWTLGLAVLVAAGIGYATLRQGVAPRTETAAVARRDLTLLDDEWVLVLPDGSGLPWRWARRARLVRTSAGLIVCCPLARSAALFEAPPGLRYDLPLAAGFGLRDGSGRLWHGISGRSLDGGDPLDRGPVGLMPAPRWRHDHADGSLLGPTEGPLTGGPPPRVRVPGAILEANDETPGFRDVDGWRSLPAGGFDPPREPVLILAKWADRLLA